MKKFVALAAGVLGLAALGDWRVEFYGDTTFYGAQGETVKPDELKLQIAGGFKWNARRAGWSYRAEGIWTAPEAGRYVFRTAKGPADTGAYRIAVNGAFADESPEGIELGAGEARVALYARHKDPEKPRQEYSHVKVEWAKAGGGEYRAMEAKAVEKLTGGYPVGFGREFKYAEGEHLDFGSRSFKFKVEEAGLYELAFKCTALPRFVRLWLDDLQVAFHCTRGGVDGKASRQGDIDRTGRKDIYRMDYFGKLKSVRWLEKGEYRLDAYAYWGPWFWGDEMGFMEEKKLFRLGVTRLEGKSAGETGFWLEGRDAMVFEANKGLKVRAQSAAEGEREHVMEVRDAAGKKTWEQKLSVGKKAVRFEYPCAEEGAFDYVIRNGRGEVVDGPWAFAVVDPTPLKRVKCGEGKPAAKVLADSVECTEGEGGEHDFRDNGTSKLVSWEGGTYRATGTKGFHSQKAKYVKIKKGHLTAGFRLAKPGEKGDMDSGSMCDWFAYTLKVKNPGRTHLVTVTVPNDEVRYISAAAHDRVTGDYNAWNVQAGDAPAAGPWSTMSFFVWPNTDKIDVMVYCSNGNHNSPLNRQSAAKKIELWEFPEGAPALGEAAIGWGGKAEYGWTGEQVDLGVNERTMPPLWSDPGKMIKVNEQGRPFYRSWNAFFHAWKRFGETSAFHGHNLCVFPVYSYSMLLFQGKAMRMIPAGNDRYAYENACGEVVDPFDRDLFMMMLMQGSKYGVKIVADFMIQNIGRQTVECWARKWGEDPKGMLLTSGAGDAPARSFSNATFVNPAHPAVRKQMVAFVEELAKRYGKFPAFGGLHHRFWAQWPAAFEGWFWSADLGCDDWTVGLFSKETGIEVEMAGGDEKKFAARKAKLYGELKEAWMDWRAQKCLTLREEMLAALQRHAPQAKLYASGKLDGFAEGCGIEKAKFEGRRELGWGVDKVGIGGPDVEWNFTDPVAFAKFNRREAPYGNVPTEEWGGTRIGRYPQGVCCNSAYRVSPYHLKPAALALAAGEMDVLYAGGQWCIPPADEELRKFVQVWRAIPEEGGERFEMPGGKESPVIVRSVVKREGWLRRGRRIFWMVNRTDSRRKVEVEFEGDMGKIANGVDGSVAGEGRKMTVELPPYQALIFKAEKGHDFAKVEIPLRKEELAEIEAAYRTLAEMEPRAAGLVHVRVGEGERYTNCGNTDKLGNYDVRETFEDVFGPVREAHSKGMMHEVWRLTTEFKTKHAWWYEALGWPKDWCRVRTVGRGMLAGFVTNPQEVHSKTLTKANLKKFEDAPNPMEQTFVVVKREERAHLYVHGSAGWRLELEVQGWFGGGYGNIRVEDEKGKVLGRIEADAGAPRRMETRVLGVPLMKTGNGIHLYLVGEGPEGMALLRFSLRNLPAKIVNEMMVLGPLDRYAGNEGEVPKGRGGQFIATGHGLDFELAPEREEFDAEKEYEGLYGAKVKWKKAEIGEKKIFELLKECPYDITCGRGCAYGVVWVKSEKGARVCMNHTAEFFSKIWVNGKLAKPLDGGPTRVWKATEVQLRPGWNKVMVKAACGSVGWYLGLSFSDANKLEFSATPPSVAKGKK